MGLSSLVLWVRLKIVKSLDGDMGANITVRQEEWHQPLLTWGPEPPERPLNILDHFHLESVLHVRESVARRMETANHPALKDCIYWGDNERCGISTNNYLVTAYYPFHYYIGS